MRVEALEDEHRSGKWTGDVHAKVDDDIVAVGDLGAVGDVLGSATSVKGEREWRAHLRAR